MKKKVKSDESGVSSLYLLIILIIFRNWGLILSLLSINNHSIHSVFTPWVVTSAITSFGMNIE